MSISGNNRGCRAVLWDLDGTIVDTSPAHYASWRAVLAGEGYELTWEQFVPTFGQRNDRVIPMFLGPDLAQGEVVRIAEAKESLYRDLLAAEPPELLPGARDWLGRLAAAGWQQALATMAPRPNIEAVLAALDLGKYFAATVSGDEVLRGKPDPGIFTLAAARLAVRPQACVVVEDSPAGVEAARRAGMPSVGASRRERLAADIAVATLAELPPDAFDRLVAAGIEL